MKIPSSGGLSNCFAISICRAQASAEAEESTVSALSSPNLQSQRSPSGFCDDQESSPQEDERQLSIGSAAPPGVSSTRRTEQYCRNAAQVVLAFSITWDGDLDYVRGYLLRGLHMSPRADCIM